MVSLPGDIAPERFRGFRALEPPQTELLRRQYASFPPWDFLSHQGGFKAGIYKPGERLRSLDGFMHTTTNYNSVQNGPAYLKMRLQEVLRKRLRLEAERLERDRIAVHSVSRRKKAAKAKPYLSKAAGLALKTAQTGFIEKDKNGKDRIVHKGETVEVAPDILLNSITPNRKDLAATKLQLDKELAQLESPEAKAVALAKERLSASARLAVEKEIEEKKRVEALKRQQEALY
jgi:hypothetical protein